MQSKHILFKPAVGRHSSILSIAILIEASLCLWSPGSISWAEEKQQGQPSALSTSSQREGDSQLEGFETTFGVMGSTMSIIAYSDSEAVVTKAFEEAQVEAVRLNQIMTDYETDSELNLMLSKSPEPTKVSNELWEVLSASQRWYERSEGAFDASVGTLTRLWRTARRAKRTPSDLEIDEAKRKSGWSFVFLDSELKEVSVKQSGLKIDLGGIAAGYIVDRVFDLMVANNINCCLINAGGDIRCGNPPPGRVGWRIEVAPLAAKGTSADLPLRRIYLANAAIVTSGDLWQFFDFKGIRRSHILDPKTGVGVPGPSVVAVIAPLCVDADAAATAISVMGIQKGMLFASQQTDIQAMMVTRDPQSDKLTYRITENFPSGSYDSKD